MIGIGISPMFQDGAGLNFNGVPSLLSATAISDVRIDLAWTIGSTNQTGHKVERSIDNITFAEIGTVLGATATYSDTSLTTNTLYYYRVRAYVSSKYSAYTNVSNDYTAMKLVASATGNGSGISIIEVSSSANIVVKCDGNGTFSTDITGANPVTTKSFNGNFQRLFFKCTSGNSNILFFSKNTLTRCGRFSSGYSFWSEFTLNSPTTTFSIAYLAKSVAELFQYHAGTPIGGNINDKPTEMTILSLQQSNTITGTLPVFSAISVLDVRGQNTLSGNLSNINTGAYNIFITGNNTMIDYTSGHNWGTTLDQVCVIPVSGGLSSAEVDALLIDVAATVVTWTGNKRINLTGANAPRTAASNAAVATIISMGTTVTTS